MAKKPTNVSDLRNVIQDMQSSISEISKNLEGSMHKVADSVTADDADSMAGEVMCIARDAIQMAFSFRMLRGLRKQKDEMNALMQRNDGKQ